MDPVGAAAGAVAVLTPYLAEAGKGAAGEVGKSAWAGATKLWALLRGRLSRPEQQAALADLQAQPFDADVQAAARVQLKKALAADAGLLAELAELQSLPEAGGQKASIVGNNGTIGQADRGSTVIIGGH